MFKQGSRNCNPPKRRDDNTQNSAKHCPLLKQRSKFWYHSYLVSNTATIAILRVPGMSNLSQVRWRLNCYFLRGGTFKPWLTLYFLTALQPSMQPIPTSKLVKGDLRPANQLDTGNAQSLQVPAITPLPIECLKHTFACMPHAVDLLCCRAGMWPVIDPNQNWQPTVSVAPAARIFACVSLD